MLFIFESSPTNIAFKENQKNIWQGDKDGLKRKLYMGGKTLVCCLYKQYKLISRPANEHI